MSAPRTPFLFIVGCPRSGTSLVTGMLSARVAVPYETHFIPLFYRTRGLWGDLRRRASRARLLGNIFEFLKLWTVRAARGRELSRVRRISLLAVEPEAEHILDRSDSFQTLVEQLYASYARVHGLERWGDKSAFFDHMALERLESAIPGSRYLHVIRDGRDVALSWMKEPYGPSDVAEAARAWARHLEQKRRFGEQRPEQYLELRYEDLLKAPRTAMERVAHFAGFDYDDALLDFRRNEFAAVFASGEAHPLMSQPLVESNQGKWRSEMPRASRRLFEREAGSTLEAFGYELEAAGSNAGIAARALASRLRAPLTSHRVRLALKQLLPVMLGLAGRVGIPLARALGSSRWPAKDTR